MTIVYEIRTVQSQILLIQFQFASLQRVKVKQNNVYGFSLDKYLTLDAWSDIYKKLNDLIERAGQKTTQLEQLKSETIRLKRSQLELKINYKKTEEFHTDIIKQEAKSCDVCPHMMRVKIEMYTDIQGYKKGSSSKSNKADGENVSVTKITETSENGGGRKSNLSMDEDSKSGDTISRSTKTDDEYIPSSRSNVNAKVSYTPSKLSQCHKEANEYTPPGEIDDIIIYSPRKIDGQKTSPKPYTIPKTRSKDGKIDETTDYNKNDCSNDTKSTKPSKDLQQDLFGDSDDNEMATIVTRSARKRTDSKPTKPINGDNRVTKKQQGDLNDWIVNRDKSKKVATTSNDKKRKIDFSNQPNVEQQAKKANPTGESELDRLRQLNIQFQKINKPVVVDEILNLKELSNEEILQTFDQHLKKLRTLFNELKYQANSRFVLADDFSFSNLIESLLTSEQQTTMVRKLDEHFCNSDAASTHGNLIWKRLLPEWALEIFMNNYMMDRKEALQRLNLQIVAEVQNISIDGLEIM